MDEALFPGIVYLVAGLYMLWQGWLRLQIPPSELTLWSLPELGSLLLVRLFQGVRPAAAHRARLLQPKRLRRSGFYYLLVGALLTLAGGVLLFLWVWQSVSA